MHNRAAASCSSCILATILLRYAAQEDLSDYWQQMDYTELKRLLSEKRRKHALVALLSHWQTIICSQVKVIVFLNTFEVFGEEVKLMQISKLWLFLLAYVGTLQLEA